MAEMKRIIDSQKNKSNNTIKQLIGGDFFTSVTNEAFNTELHQSSEIYTNNVLIIDIKETNNYVQEQHHTQGGKQQKGSIYGDQSPPIQNQVWLGLFFILIILIVIVAFLIIRALQTRKQKNTLQRGNQTESQPFNSNAEHNQEVSQYNNTLNEWSFNF